MLSHVFHQLYYHFVWATHNRLPLITDQMRNSLVKWVEAEARNRGGVPISCYAMPDHVHLLVSLPPTACVSEFIFAWQEGYGVITVRKAETPKIIRYIEDQPAIHAARKASRTLETTYIA
jgi:putative transposase